MIHVFINNCYSRHQYVLSIFLGLLQKLLATIFQFGRAFSSWLRWMTNLGLFHCVEIRIYEFCLKLKIQFHPASVLFACGLLGRKCIFPPILIPNDVWCVLSPLLQCAGKAVVTLGLSLERGENVHWGNVVFPMCDANNITRRNWTQSILVVGC